MRKAKIGLLESRLPLWVTGAQSQLGRRNCVNVPPDCPTGMSGRLSLGGGGGLHLGTLIPGISGCVSACAPEKDQRGSERDKGRPRGGQLK